MPLDSILYFLARSDSIATVERRKTPLGPPLRACHCWDLSLFLCPAGRSAVVVERITDTVLAHCSLHACPRHGSYQGAWDAYSLPHRRESRLLLTCHLRSLYNLLPAPRRASRLVELLLLFQRTPWLRGNPSKNSFAFAQDVYQEPGGYPEGGAELAHVVWRLRLRHDGRRPWSR